MNLKIMPRSVLFAFMLLGLTGGNVAAGDLADGDVLGPDNWQQAQGAPAGGVFLPVTGAVTSATVSSTIVSSR